LKNERFHGILVRNGAIILVLVLVLSFLLAACSSSPVTSVITTTTTQATTSTTSVVTTTTTTSAQLSIKLKYHTNFPPTAGPSQEGLILADVLSKLSNGRITMEVFPAEQLGPNSAVLDLLKNGITDMAALGLPPFPTLFPLENGQELPLGILPDAVTATTVRNQLSMGDFGQAFSKNNLKFISWNMVRPMQFFLTKKITKAEDFNGMKIRSPNPLILQPFQPFGAVPVSMQLGEVYESLQRGVINGCVNSPENAAANKWFEVTKFHITQNLSYGGTVVVMSKSRWDTMPDDIKAIFNQALSPWLTQVFAFYKDQDSKTIAAEKTANVEVYSLDPAEAARWVQLTAPVIDAWAAKTDAPGIPAKAMIEQIRKSAAK
jgi:TRAP-type C4-dicarboxylate transport system substrate-binding protein